MGNFGRKRPLLATPSTALPTGRLEPAIPYVVCEASTVRQSRLRRSAIVGDCKKIATIMRLNGLARAIESVRILGSKCEYARRS